MQAARDLIGAAEKAGVTLAIIAVRKGRLTVGLEPWELEAIVRDGPPRRATRRDLAWAVVKGFDAGTTVSSSMYIASRAGIRLLVTGALGAVRPLHAVETRPAEVSSDLVELMGTPVAVVTAGARSVADVVHTAEVLETFRVPVIGYGSDIFPTFYMRVGKCSPSVRIDTTRDVAAMLRAHWMMDGAGVVIAQPTPAHLAFSPDEILPALQFVEDQAGNDMVTRKHLSPVLMERLNNLTHGKAMRAYQGILLANTQLAAQIAVELARKPQS
jgi:pseudouridine-5'-phosphate glycosidase